MDCPSSVIQLGNVGNESSRRLAINPAIWPYLIIGVASLIGIGLGLTGNIQPTAVLGSFQWGILAVYVALELYTRLMVQTGVMESSALWLAKKAQGRQELTLLYFAALLFVISALMNNITAVMVVLPIIFILFHSMHIDRKFVIGFFSLLLAISNLAGASTPIGDYPALIIMKSGITSFGGYLVRAFPLFLTTGMLLTGLHILFIRRQGRGTINEQILLEQRLGVEFLGVQYRYRRLNLSRLLILSGIFTLMFIGWSVLPSERFPVELTAICGLGVASVIMLMGDRRVEMTTLTLTPILSISGFLFLAAVASHSGVLARVATSLQHSFHDPLQLLIATMILTSLLSGICSAGPAAAAMMPIVYGLATGPLLEHRHWVATAFAAAICAGSSLFAWSASAGFLLMEKVHTADLRTAQGQPVHWGIASYLRYGLMHYVIQLSVGICWIIIGIRWF